MHRLIRTQIDFYCTAEIAEDAEFFYRTQIFTRGADDEHPSTISRTYGARQIFFFFHRRLAWHACARAMAGRDRGGRKAFLFYTGFTGFIGATFLSGSLSWKNIGHHIFQVILSWWRNISFVTCMHVIRKCLNLLMVRCVIPPFFSFFSSLFDDNQ